MQSDFSLGEPQHDRDEWIFKTPISPERRRRFLENYRQDRTQARTVEALFQRAGAYRRIAERGKPEDTFGVNVLLRKGPFVDASSWAEYRTWQIALAVERHVIQKLAKLLTPAPSLFEHDQTLPKTLEAIDRLIGEATTAGYEPSAIIVAGALDPDLIGQFWQHELTRGDWELGDMSEVVWLLGSYRDLPVARFDEMPDRGVYVLDIKRFALLTQFSDVEFEAKPIDEASARQLLQQSENIIHADPGQPDTYPTRLHALQMRVHVTVYESLAFDLLDSEAVFRSRIPPGSHAS